MMRIIARLLFIVVIISVLSPLLPQKVVAGDLGTKIRIDKQSISKTTGGTICLTPETNGVESSVQIIFPSGFTVNPSASNWTITTTNLPSGTVPLPGVGTATSVSGQTVTFLSNDLVTGTEYCFNFSSSNTLTTPSSTGTYTGILRTMNSSNQAIDYHAYAISIATSDSIAVTATAPANPTDFQAILSANRDQNDYIRENSTINYSLSYGSYPSYPISIVVEAQWELGTIQGNSTPTEGILEYDIGSASNAYGNTPPVIDSLNNKITWTISNFPASTIGQIVTFRLKTNNNHVGSLPVNLTVSGRVLGPATQTADSKAYSTYLYSSYITPTPRPTCVPSACPTSAPTTPTPSPTPILINPVIHTVELRSVSSTNAAIFVRSNNNVKVKVLYGTSLNSLNLSESSNIYAKEDIITLQNLKSKTRYYFRVIATDSDGKRASTDLYVLDTASEALTSRVINGSLILTSGDVVLTDPFRLHGEIPNIVMPVGTNYAFKFAVDGYDKIKSIKGFVRSNSILGISSDSIYSNYKSLNITEINPGQYIGRLSTDNNPDKYNLVLQIQDFTGNISEQTVSHLNIVTPMRIINKGSKLGIENAKTTFYFFNSRLRTYELISQAITPIGNPLYSTTDGNISAVLPGGKYRAEIEVLGYQTRTVDFEIGPNAPNYPIIELSPLPFNIATYIKYSASTTYDALQLLRSYIHTLRSSIRFFDLIAFIIILFFTFLSLFATSQHMAVPIFHLPNFAKYHLTNFFKRKKDEFVVHGKILGDITGNIVPGALIYLTNNKGKVISHTTSNSSGEFLSLIREATDLRISIIKKGFKNISHMIKMNDLNNLLTLELVEKKKPSGITIQTLFWYIDFIWDSLFEAILIITLLTELLFVIEFGILKVMPFIILSTLNIFLWTMHVRNTRSAGI